MVSMVCLPLVKSTYKDEIFCFGHLQEQLVKVFEQLPINELALLELLCVVQAMGLLQELRLSMYSSFVYHCSISYA